MSGRRPIASKWTCADCGVSVSRIDGAPAPLPDVWSSSAEGDFCLACRRQRAVEATIDAAPGDIGRDIRAKLRRTGLIEFEVRRTPNRTDGTIARTCRSSVSTVAAARRRLKLGEGPPPGSEDDLAAARRGKVGRLRG